jgi:signal transduction histidine kinase
MKKLEDLGREELITTVRSLLGEAEALSSRIAAVNEIGIAINRTFDLSEILRVVSRQAKWLLDFEHLSVCLPDEALKDTWRIATLFGPTAEYDPFGLAATHNVGYVLKTGQPRLIKEGCESPILRSFLSQIVIPLNSDDHVTGAIIFASTAPHQYRQEDMRIGYLLALQLSSALRNANQFDQLKQAQAELRLYAHELEARNQELDAYNHTIAHDLKSPITGMVLKIEVIKMIFRDLPPDAVKHMDDIKGNALKMADMIDQLLWLTKLRDAAASVELVDVNQVVESALARFQHLIDRDDITIHFSADLPPAMGHAQWIEEVFANLISNAIKYMGKENPAPTITISGIKQNSLVRYEVRDTGVGITPKDQAHLFEMFTRLHTVEADGLGLGLSIVRRIITKLNGQLGVDSKRGKGSTFWFTIPAG